MKRLPILLFVGGVLLCVLYLWQARVGEAARQALELQLRVFDADGYPLAGAEIVRLHALRQEVVGSSDAFGAWQGRLYFAQDNMVELQIKKTTALGLWRAQRSYRTGQGRRQDSVRLRAVPQHAAARAEHVRLEVAEPFLRQALHAWCQRAGVQVAAHGERVLTVHDDHNEHLQVSLTTGGHDLFSFQVTYRVLHSSATLQKILHGIYAHTARAYTAWHEAETGNWHVYNPAGFWQLRSDAVLVNAQGRRFYPQAQQPRDRRQLALAVADHESVCSARECVVYSAHARQEVY